MQYVNHLIQKWMPQGQRVAVNSTPKLHGIFDTINATLAASSPKIRLPEEFLDAKAYSIMDRILMQEEYSGYTLNNEYRKLGIGALLGEVMKQMIDKSKPPPPHPSDSSLPKTHGEGGPALALYGCHDSTLASTMTSLGAWSAGEGSWPPYTSSLAIELFRSKPRSALERTGNSAHYVRLRYNDEAITLPGCKRQGYHLPGRKEFCTMVCSR